MSEYRVNHSVTIENAHIMYRNFSGKPGQFNREGARNFCVELPYDLAKEMSEEGWNVKFREPRNEDESPFAYIQVAVSFNNRPPMIWTVTSNNRALLSAETVDILDVADIESCDLVFVPYNYEVNGRCGVKAYLKKMYVNLVEDDLDEKYADIPTGNINTNPEHED